MKRAGMAFMVIAAMTGCSAPNEEMPEDPQQTAAPKTVTDAQQVLTALRAANLPIDKVRTITAETDANKMLGRPHQYTSKIDFLDTRFPDGKLEEATNNIEVFATPEDAQRRHDYIDGVMKDLPMATQYLILRKNILVRINNAVSPTAAKEYEAAVEGLVTDQTAPVG